MGWARSPLPAHSAPPTQCHCCPPIVHLSQGSGLRRSGVFTSARVSARRQEGKTPGGSVTPCLTGTPPRSGCLGASVTFLHSLLSNRALNSGFTRHCQAPDGPRRSRAAVWGGAGGQARTVKGELGLPVRVGSRRDREPQSLRSRVTQAPPSGHSLPSVRAAGRARSSQVVQRTGPFPVAPRGPGLPVIPGQDAVLGSRGSSVGGGPADHPRPETGTRARGPCLGLPSCPPPRPPASTLHSGSRGLQGGCRWAWARRPQGLKPVCGILGLPRVLEGSSASPLK